MANLLFPLLHIGMAQQHVFLGVTHMSSMFCSLTITPSWLHLIKLYSGVPYQWIFFIFEPHSDTWSDSQPVVPPHFDLFHSWSHKWVSNNLFTGQFHVPLVLSWCSSHTTFWRPFLVALTSSCQCRHPLWGGETLEPSALWTKPGAAWKTPGKNNKPDQAAYAVSTTGEEKRWTINVSGCGAWMILCQDRSTSTAGCLLWENWAQIILIYVCVCVCVSLKIIVLFGNLFHGIFMWLSPCMHGLVACGDLFITSPGLEDLREFANLTTGKGERSYCLNVSKCSLYTFYNDPTPLNGSTQFHYCTYSNLGTGADATFVFEARHVA